MAQNKGTKFDFEQTDHYFHFILDGKCKLLKNFINIIVMFKCVFDQDNGCTLMPWKRHYIKQLMQLKESLFSTKHVC